MKNLKRTKRIKVRKNVVIEQKTIQQLGDSAVVIIPSYWRKPNAMYIGELIDLVVMERGILIVPPEEDFNSEAIIRDLKDAQEAFDEYQDRKNLWKWFNGLSPERKEEVRKMHETLEKVIDEDKGTLQ